MVRIMCPGASRPYYSSRVGLAAFWKMRPQNVSSVDVRVGVIPTPLVTDLLLIGMEDCLLSVILRHGLSGIAFERASTCVMTTYPHACGYSLHDLRLARRDTDVER